MNEHNFKKAARFFFIAIFILTELIFVGCDKDKVREEPLPSPPPGAPKQVDRVIFILLDAARADHFGAYGYKLDTTPNMDGIAKKGALFLNHYSQSHATTFSTPQMFGGKYFGSTVIERLSEYPSSRYEYPFVAPDPTRVLIPELLNRAGFYTICFSAHFRITRNSSLGKSFREIYPIKEKYEAAPHAEKIVPSLQRWITQNRDKQFFVYLHLMDTHFPHKIKPEYSEFMDANYDWRKRFRESGAPKTGGKNPWDKDYYIGDINEPGFLKHLNAIYDGDLKRADKWVGALYETLENLGIAENTLVVITSDHGEELGDHGYYSHVGKAPWDSSYRIPLIMTWPDKIKAGKTISAFTEHIDLLPTLAEMLNAPIPEGKTTDGKSMVPLLGDPNAKVRDFACGVMEGAKFIRTQEWMAGLYGESGKYLYDKKTDPMETLNIADSRPEIFDKLIKTLDDETGAAYAKWTATPLTRPADTFVVSFKNMDANLNIPNLGRDPSLNIAPGQWGKKGKFFVGRGGDPNAQPLILIADVPTASYIVDVEAVHAFRFPFGGAASVSVFSAAFGDSSLRRFNSLDTITWKEKYFRSKDKKWWKATYIPLGIAEVKNNKLILTIKLDADPSNWVVVKSLRLTPLGKKRTELTKEERNKLKDLGYIQ